MFAKLTLTFRVRRRRLPDRVAPIAAAAPIRPSGGKLRCRAVTLASGSKAQGVTAT